MSQQSQSFDVPARDEMPMLGLGTWENDDHSQCADSVTMALNMGYRHIDTAQIYRNEAGVGDGIAAIPVVPVAPLEGDATGHCHADTPDPDGFQEPPTRTLRRSGGRALSVHTPTLVCPTR